ncbi:hypothetical protein L596_030601 [Steinernema carpocapsae]|uniref:F-box domain-containing protein n=1 Tax=Steinernema carpocapsae TaxID=34508 RepID=A0A4U5LPX6_STECR|nr:hypothetical protein L596_030601 [Steinernema carpocapsae]
MGSEDQNKVAEELANLVLNEASPEAESPETSEWPNEILLTAMRNMDTVTLLNCRLASHQFKAAADKILFEERRVNVIVGIREIQAYDCIEVPGLKDQSIIKSATRFTPQSIKDWPNYVNVGGLSISSDYEPISEDYLFQVDEALHSYRAAHLHSFSLNHELTEGTLKILGTVAKKPLTTMRHFHVVDEDYSFDQLEECRGFLAKVLPKLSEIRFITGPFSIGELLAMICRNPNSLEIEFSLYGDYATSGEPWCIVPLLKNLVEKPRAFKLSFFCEDQPNVKDYYFQIATEASTEFLVRWGPHFTWSVATLDSKWKIVFKQWLQGRISMRCTDEEVVVFHSY